MIRITATTLAGVAAAALVACTAPTPAQYGFGLPRNTDSPIAGATLHCARDYPDSRLVFGKDGTLGGRYAGHEVSGEWSAIGPGQVEMILRAGGIAVRDIVHRTTTGWHGGNTACG